MARSRSIKPALFDNELLGEADPILTVLFIGLWTLADRQGRLEDRPKRIKKALFGYRDGVPIDHLIQQLVGMGFLERYRVGDLAVLQVVNFAKHQNPHCKEAPSELPARPSAAPSVGTVRARCEHGASTVPAPEDPERAVLTPDSLNLTPDCGLLTPECGSLTPDSRETGVDADAPTRTRDDDTEHAELATVSQAANEQPRRGIARRSSREQLLGVKRPSWFAAEAFGEYCDSHEHEHGKAPNPFALPALFAGMQQAIDGGTDARDVIAAVVAGGWRTCRADYGAFARSGQGAGNRGNPPAVSNHTGFDDRDYRSDPALAGWTVAGAAS